MRFVIVAICFVVTAILFAAGLAGTYKGSYSGSAGASGDIVVLLKQADNGDWKSEVTFGYNGEDVKTRVTSVKVDGTKVTIVYEFELGGNALESTLTGELKDGGLAGEYHARATADGSAVDEGTWKATAQ